MQSKQIAQLTIVLAAVNAVLGLISGKWYLIVAAVFLAVLAALGALRYLSAKTPESLRSFSWYNIISGLSILSLAFSSFYSLPSMGFVQVILAAIIILMGCYTLYEAVKKHGLPIIP